MTIRVLSFSFDGCLSSEIPYPVVSHLGQKSSPSQGRDVIAANAPLLNQLNADKTLYSKSIVFSGSYRQSVKSESLYPAERGSSFPQMKEVSDYLEASFSPLLLADIYGDLEDGTSFRRGMDPAYKGEHAEWLFDKSKVLIIQAQMHQVAMEAKAQQLAKGVTKDEPIVFCFFENRKDVLDDLNKFYSANPDLIPKNVSLQLYNYSGTFTPAEEAVIRKPYKPSGPEPVFVCNSLAARQIRKAEAEEKENEKKNESTLVKPKNTPTLKPYSTIKGNGFIDKNYKQTVRDMGEQARGKYPFRHLIKGALVGMETYSSDTIDVAKDVKPRLLMHRATFENPVSGSVPDARALQKSSGSTTVAPAPVPNPVVKAATLLADHIAIIRIKSLKLKFAKHHQAAAAANTLCSDLINHAQEYDAGRIDEDIFKSKCSKAIVTARKTLDSHRGWSQCLGNLAITLLSLGVGLVAKGIYNLVQNRPFLFLCQTDSANKLDSVQKQIDSMDQKPGFST